ncbi:MAG: hypothetical protein WDW38_004813 [Sanguina aurantia]
MLATAQVVVFSTPACPYCKKAKALLTQQGVAYAEVNVGDSAALRQELRDVTASKTVPQVFVNGRLVGGSDALAAAVADGSFRALLAASPPSSEALPAKLKALSEEDAAARALAVGAQGSVMRTLPTLLAASKVDSTASAKQTQLAALAQRMADVDSGGVSLTGVKIGSRTVPAFSAVAALRWLGANPHPTTPSQPTPAPVLAQQLLEARLIAAVGDGTALADAFVRFDPAPSEASATVHYVFVGAGSSGGSSSGGGSRAATAPAPSLGQALNTTTWWYGPARPAGTVATELRGLILQLYESHLSADGFSVSYGRMARDPLFQQYVAATAELQKDRMALFINLYNANIVHTLVAHGPGVASSQRSKFFQSFAKYNIGGLEYSADDMENGVLRGNRPSAGSLWSILGLPQFSGGHFSKADDPRRAQVVTPCDARIHFALVCGAKSCPPIKLYTPDNLDEGLAAASEAYCAGEVEVVPATHTVTVPMLLKWYAVDFGAGARQRCEFLLQFLTGEKQAALAKLLGDKSREPKIQYKPYDWSVNSDGT